MFYFQVKFHVLYFVETNDILKKINFNQTSNALNPTKDFG